MEPPARTPVDDSLELDPYHQKPPTPVNIPQKEPIKSSSYVPPPPGSKPCVVCKHVHLSCDRARPCSRCVRLGREADCVDPPDQPRGRPSSANRPDAPKRPKVARTKKKDENTLPHTADPQVDSRRKDSAISVHNQHFESLMAQGRVSYFYDGNIILGCTSEFADYFGYKQSELIGMSAHILIPPELVDIHRKKVKAFLAAVPPETVQLSITCNAVYMSRHGRRFEAKVSGRSYFKPNGAVSLMHLTVCGINRDNIPPGSLPSGYNSAVNVKVTNREGQTSDYQRIVEVVAEIYDNFNKTTQLMIPAPGFGAPLPAAHVQAPPQSPPVQFQSPSASVVQFVPLPRTASFVPIARQEQSSAAEEDDYNLGGVLFF